MFKKTNKKINKKIITLTAFAAQLIFTSTLVCANPFSDGHLTSLQGYEHDNDSDNKITDIKYMDMFNDGSMSFPLFTSPVTYMPRVGQVTITGAGHGNYHAMDGNSFTFYRSKYTTKTPAKDPWTLSLPPGTYLYMNKFAWASSDQGIGYDSKGIHLQYFGEDYEWHNAYNSANQGGIPGIKHLKKPIVFNKLRLQNKHISGSCENRRFCHNVIINTFEPEVFFPGETPIFPEAFPFDKR